MKSKFKRTQIAVMLLIAGSSAHNVCAQSFSPPVQTGHSQARQNSPLVPTGQVAPGNLPPIVSGAQQQQSPSGFVPPIVSGSGQTPQRTYVPPIVSGSSVPQDVRPEETAGQSSMRKSQPQVMSRPVSQGTLPMGMRPASSGSSSLSTPPTQGRTNPLQPIPTLNQTVGFPRSSATANNEAPNMPQTVGQAAPNPGISSAGVPYYSSATRHSPELTVDQPQMPGQANHPGYPGMQKISHRRPDGSVVQDGPGPETVQRETNPTQGMPSVMTPRNGSAGGTMPQSGSLLPGQPTTGNGETYFDMSAQPQFTPGCQDCLAAGGAAHCPTCNGGNYGNVPMDYSGYGNGGMDSGLFGQGKLNGASGYFGAMSCARRYAEIDMLYMTRKDGAIVFSNAGGLGSFDWDIGWRGTIGEREDETQGRELSYFGTLDIEQQANRVDGFGRLEALFQPVGVIDNSLVAPFFDANIQNESMRTRLHSLEFNRVSWAWDVVKSFWGVRFMHIKDTYYMFSQRGVNTAEYDLSSLNNLAGLHIGRELFYDVGYRLSFSACGKAGVYVNGNRFELDVRNNGTSFLTNRNDASTFSTSLELIFQTHYQINRRARFRAGYQALMLDEVYTVSDNLTGTLSPFFGSRKADKDSMLFHGASFGFEFYR